MGPRGADGAVVATDDSTFAQEVLAAHGPVLVYHRLKSLYE